MNSIWLQLGLVGVLVTLNALFAGSEMALVSLREAQLAKLEQQGGRGALLARLAREPNQFLATIQIGITLAGFLASATAAVSLAEPLQAPLEAVLGAAARPVSIVLVTAALTFLTLVFGELAPKRVALQRTESWGLLAARPLAGLATVTRPVVWLLGISTDLVVKLLGADPAQQREELTEDDLRDMVAVQPELTEHERRIIDGAFEFADHTLRQVMVPRVEVVALPHDHDAAAASAVMAESGHTRVPVHTGDLDEVIGTVHLRDLVGAEGLLADHVREVLVLPESVGCLDALHRMQEERQQMVVVIDEHGGTAGIVTVEDLLEELVGEIWDEADPDVRGVEIDPDGSMLLEGSYPVHDLVDIDVDLPRGDYTTIGGLVLAELHRIPERGDRVRVGSWDIEVVDATTRRVERVRLVPVEESLDED
ncbi:hemolysin family protein [Euzebya rosea]|uniref:hemolysin family protein n=1 Tax=Euzebya rosea TaxID=2052804 RepID=UPI000D3E45A1|nr:hemolysin family protein [Euzebya rosea]